MVSCSLPDIGAGIRPDASMVAGNFPFPCISLAKASSGIGGGGRGELEAEGVPKRLAS